MNVPRTLLLLAGFFFLVSAVLYNPLTLELLVRVLRRVLDRQWLQSRPAGDIFRAEIVYFATSAICFFLASAIARFAALDRFFRRGIVERVFLAGIILFVPLFGMEVALRPFSRHLHKGTSLFQRDAELGWVLRPSATQPWGGVTVQTNAQGLRGPGVDYARNPAKRRVLYLGDSVTFGYGVARWEDAYPWRVEALLQERGIASETINAGVGGYSPWQEDLWLRREGVRYNPDLVVVGFVLNDVTEKFSLSRYGGSGEGRQLRDSFVDPWDRLLGRSAIVYHVRKVTAEYRARKQLGNDLRLGAIRQEVLDVNTIIESPDAETVQLAWEITLENLGKITTFCREQNIPIMVVVFPYTMQLENRAERSAPQERLAAWALAHDVPCVDTLPVLARMTESGALPVDSLFLDHDHLTTRGHRVVARSMVALVAELLGVSYDVDEP